MIIHVWFAYLNANIWNGSIWIDIFEHEHLNYYRKWCLEVHNLKETFEQKYLYVFYCQMVHKSYAMVHSKCYKMVESWNKGDRRDFSCTRKCRCADDPLFIRCWKQQIICQSTSEVLSFVLVSKINLVDCLLVVIRGYILMKGSKKFGW